MDLQGLYGNRFPQEELTRKNAIWSVLCKDFFAKFVKPTDTVVDIGAGYCEFINNIEAANKFAIDLNPDVRRFAAENVTVLNENCTAVATLPDASADIVFMSNFLEHLPGKEMVIRTLQESFRLLIPGGSLMILQPNIRFVGGAYWDYFDHHTPLTERSLCEALRVCGFDIEYCVARFLPYTTKSALPQAAWLVRLYLKMPLAWRLFGKQAFVVGRKPRGHGDSANTQARSSA